MFNPCKYAESESEFVVPPLTTISKITYSSGFIILCFGTAYILLKLGIQF